MTDESVYQIDNPYRHGIDGMALPFAIRTLRQVREALEHGQKPREERVERLIREALAEADTVKRLLSARKERAA